MAKVYQVAQIRALEAAAIAAGLAESTLMDQAGAAAFALLKKRYPNANRIGVCCGGGHNGGDGYVLARLAHAAGLVVTVLTPADPERLPPIAHLAYRAACAVGIDVQPAAKPLLADANVEVWVDALLGIGLNTTVSATYAALIEALNDSPAPVFALDVPSGYCADTGMCLGVGVKADATLTFIGLKPGLLTHQGRAACGALHLDKLNLDPALYNTATPVANAWWGGRVPAVLGPRSPDAHKGHGGHVCIVGGNLGYAGAAQLAGVAALRVGAGLVSIATRPEQLPLVQAGHPELMCHGITNPDDLIPLLKRANVVLLGPGLGRDAWAASLFEGVMHASGRLVLDADALHFLQQTETRLVADNVVITPHPGEAARLLGCAVADVQADRLQALAALQSRYGATTVLKGPGTLVGNGQALPMICRSGHEGLASGGMGDVLAGVIAGLMAQTLSTLQAVQCGVLAHGWAADLASAELPGPRGLLASDLWPVLPRTVNPSLTAAMQAPIAQRILPS